MSAHGSIQSKHPTSGVNILHVSHETLYWYDFPAKFASDQAVRPAAHSGVRLQANAETRLGRYVATTTLKEQLRSIVGAETGLGSGWRFLN